MNEKLIIDATNTVLGRLASYSAKQALLGKEVYIVNCNDAIVVGIKANIIKEYYLARKRGGASLNGPFFPKMPEKIVKRTIRGMLDYTGGRGDAAFKRIKCYNKVPAEFATGKKVSIAREITSKFMKLSEVEAVI